MYIYSEIDKIKPIFAFKIPKNESRKWHKTQTQFQLCYQFKLFLGPVICNNTKITLWPNCDSRLLTTMERVVNQVFYGQNLLAKFSPRNR